MIEDIDFPRIKGVKLAIARKLDESHEFEWHVYLINNNSFELRNVMVVSKGYAPDMIEETTKTSTLRQHIAQIKPGSMAIIERIDPDVFSLCNEFWVSYYAQNQLFDKKYVFMPGSLNEDNLSMINELGLEGALHS